MGKFRSVRPRQSSPAGSSLAEFSQQSIVGIDSTPKESLRAASGTVHCQRNRDQHEHRPPQFRLALPCRISPRLGARLVGAPPALIAADWHMRIDSLSDSLKTTENGVNWGEENYWIPECFACSESMAQGRIGGGCGDPSGAAGRAWRGLGNLKLVGRPPLVNFLRTIRPPALTVDMFRPNRARRNQFIQRTGAIFAVRSQIFRRSAWGVNLEKVHVAPIQLMACVEVGAARRWWGHFFK